MSGGTGGREGSHAEIRSKRRSKKGRRVGCTSHFLAFTFDTKLRDHQIKMNGKRVSPTNGEKMRKKKKKGWQIWKTPFP